MVIESRLSPHSPPQWVKPIALPLTVYGGNGELGDSWLECQAISFYWKTHGFHAGEETNDPELARDMAKLWRCVCQRRLFSTRTRAHVSHRKDWPICCRPMRRTMQAELKPLYAGLGNPVAAGYGHCRRRKRSSTSWIFCKPDDPS